jgi:ribonucleoside-diphosphate reductase alpha chain
VPQKAPENSILRHETPFKLLRRVKKVSKEWVRTGHKRGQNSHNVSATISIKEKDWDAVGKWMWENRECYNGLSVLPYDGGSYKQAPFEDCTEEQYNELFKTLNKIDLKGVVEFDDNTDLTGELACAGGACEIK